MSVSEPVFLREKNFDGYPEEDALEFLLTTAGVRADIPAMITSLIESFGSIKAILEARPAQLMKVPGVTKKAATLLAIVVPMVRVWERVNMHNAYCLGSTLEAERFCKSLLMGERMEHFCVICLNKHMRLLGYRKITGGSIHTVAVSPRLVVETALSYNACAVIVCHNHPSGSFQASQDDIQATKLLQSVLKPMEIHLVDHIIVTAAGAHSMAQNDEL